MNKLSKVLIIEDECSMREFISLYLRKEGYHVIEGRNGYEGFQQFCNHDVDLVLLDVNMPIMNGFDVCRKMREQSSVPIIAITSMENVESHLEGYEAGVDDYVTKPFKSQILMAKVKRFMQARKHNELSKIYRHQALEVNFEGRIININNEPLKLTPKEYSLLEYLIKNRNVALTRDQILIQVWGFDFEGGTRVVDSHIKKVRKKLGDYMHCIKTVVAIGYKYEDYQC